MALKGTECYEQRSVEVCTALARPVTRIQVYIEKGTAEDKDERGIEGHILIITEDGPIRRYGEPMG